MDPSGDENRRSGRGAARVLRGGPTRTRSGTQDERIFLP